MSEADQEIRELFRSLNQPLEPIATDIVPVIYELPDIQAVVFDVYGTLICSGVGDISLSEEGDRDTLLRDLLQAKGFHLKPSDGSTQDLATAFSKLIRADHAAAKDRGIEFPEVDIMEIWGKFFSRFVAGKIDQNRLRQFACEYECRVNPVWPYPDLKETLEFLRSRRIPLGIVSNAQFYSPLMIEAFLEASLTDLGFDERLLVWSYEHRLGKPSVELYEEQARRLNSAHAISPSQCLYVGNDMLKDIWAAKQAGFKTALFAGDQRSLRMRSDDDRCANLIPDRKITALDQLQGILGS